MKDDKGKMRFDLLPVRPLFYLADVYTRGAKKYADRNWEKGIQWGRVFAAMIRHAWKWWTGETFDSEDGQHHLASVAWCAFALMEYEVTHPELDDRPHGASYNLSEGNRVNGQGEINGPKTVSERQLNPSREVEDVGSSVEGGCQ